MKVFCEPENKDIAIGRIADALKKYAPKSIKFVDSEDDADLIILYVFAHRRYIWHKRIHILEKGKKYAIVQLCIRSTTNPRTEDWSSIWMDAELVWSYYYLPKLCKEDGNKVNFKFYYAPLGVDSKVFKETPHRRKFIIAGTGSGGRFSLECKNEIINVAKEVGKNVFQLGNGQRSENVAYSNLMGDEMLARYYSQCQFVSGLHRIEGFEMPVIEGLLCGARPIVFDRADSRHWFKNLAEYIPEEKDTQGSLKKLFIEGARPVADTEKDYVRKNFDWKKICGGFWQRIK